jgi:hypothetical protein
MLTLDFPIKSGFGAFLDDLDERVLDAGGLLYFAKDEDWSVVTEVVEADALVLLVSADADGFVVLEGGLALPGGRDAPVGRLSVSAQGDMRLCFLAGRRSWRSTGWSRSSEASGARVTPRRS